MNPVGVDVARALLRAKISVARMQRIKAVFQGNTERAGARGELSRAVGAAMNCVQLENPGVPDWRDWVLVVAPNHRTHASLESQQTLILRFVSAHLAVLNTRGADTSHILRDEVIDGEEVCQVRNGRRPCGVGCGLPCGT